MKNICFENQIIDNGLSTSVIPASHAWKTSPSFLPVIFLALFILLKYLGEGT
jgi:hypothetical protein